MHFVPVFPMVNQSSSLFYYVSHLTSKGNVIFEKVDVLFDVDRELLQ